ncbi:DUF6545 domain-containing protein [Microlunatus endophyticus]
MLTAAVAIAWSAAIYRLVVSASQSRTLWRSSFTAVTITVAIASTLYDFRLAIDRYLSAPNLADLLARLTISVGAGFLLVYLHTLRSDTVPVGALVGYATVTVAVLITMSSAWLLGSFHSREIDDLLTVLSTDVAVYCLAFWSMLGVSLAAMSWTCFGRWRTAHHQDPAREVSMLLIAGAGILGLAVVVLWALSLVLTMANHAGADANAAGDRLLPVAAAMSSVGIISLLVVPYLATLHVTRMRWRALRPLWRALVERYPEVHLEAQPQGGPLTRLQFGLERMIIEIFDALRIAPVGDYPADVGKAEAIIRAIMTNPVRQANRHAADLLDHSESRDDDLDQLIALAGAFERLHHASS